MSDLKVNTITANTSAKVTLDDALVVNETLEVLNTVTLSNLSVAGYVTNTAAGQLGTVTGFPVAALPTGIPATNIADGIVDNNEFNTLDGINTAVTIQSQINTIAALTSTPIGAMVYWPGTVLPEGDKWKECNGESLSISSYSELYGVFGGAIFGSAAAGYFSLPDCRGLFIRSWNHDRIDSWKDPEAGTRLDRGDTNTGDMIGTKQLDQYTSHNHNGGCGNVTSASGGTTAVGAPTATDNAGGLETRPNNIQLMMIIKVK